MDLSRFSGLGDAIGKGGKVLKAALKYGDEVGGAVKQGLKHVDELAGGAAAACRRICPSGSSTCFTAGHQVLRVVGETDPENAIGSGVALASVGDATTDSDDESNSQDRLTMYAAMFVIAAGLVAYQYWPRSRRRRPSATHAVDAVLADDDTRTLCHPKWADDLEDTLWEDEDLELKAGRTLSRV